MNVSVVRPQELGASEVTAWRTMQHANGDLGSAFLSPGFILAAARARPASRVAVLEEGQDVVGFFPFEHRRFGIGKPVAAGVSDSHAVLHAAGFEWNPRDLLDGCGLAVWEFDHLVASQIACAGQNVTRRQSPIIDLTAGYDAYVAERQVTSKKIFKSTFYKLRKLERDLGPVRFDFDVRDTSMLDLLMRWKSAQYRRTGRRDRFAIPWIERLIRELFETRSDGCAGTLSVLYSGDRVVAAHFGLRSESSLACWFPAYDVQLARYSPGLALHLKLAEAAAAAGLRYVDFGKGDEAYKQSLKNGDLLVGEGWIERPSVAASARNLQRTPRVLASNLVSRHPSLQRAARRALKGIGRVRSSA